MVTTKKQLEDRAGAVEAQIEEMYGGMHGEMESIKDHLGQAAANQVEYNERGQGIQPESSTTPTQFRNLESGRERRCKPSIEPHWWEHRQRQLEMPVFTDDIRTGKINY
ncbi:hypothetical protein Adt_03318 [Abeliophyllum distichum]|uniref:Uncharacterized protein n=1 Tax=Abeliophyllum distichum TaxID=126358 RepID=A0ABD1VY42_9LAMI